MVFNLIVEVTTHEGHDRALVIVVHTSANNLVRIKVGLSHTEDNLPSDDLDDSPLLIDGGLELLVKREEGLGGDV